MKPRTRSALWFLAATAAAGSIAMAEEPLPVKLYRDTVRRVEEIRASPLVPQREKEAILTELATYDTQFRALWAPVEAATRVLEAARQRRAQVLGAIRRKIELHNRNRPANLANHLAVALYNERGRALRAELRQSKEKTAAEIRPLRDRAEPSMRKLRVFLASPALHAFRERVERIHRSIQPSPANAKREPIARAPRR